MTEDLLILEILHNLEEHSKCEIKRGKNNTILIMLFDTNNLITMEYNLKGFSYNKIKAKAKEFREISLPSLSHVNGAERNLQISGANFGEKRNF